MIEILCGGALLFWGTLVGCALATDKPKPEPPQRRPPARCPEGSHTFQVLHEIRRECVSGCHVVRGQRVLCTTCHTAGTIWQEPETAAPTFEVAPRGGVYR